MRNKDILDAVDEAIEGTENTEFDKGMRYAMKILAGHCPTPLQKEIVWRVYQWERWANKAEPDKANDPASQAPPTPSPGQ